MSRRTAILCVIGLLLIGVAYSFRAWMSERGTSASTEQWLVAGQRALDENRWEDALRACEQVLQRHPDHPDALLIAATAATTTRQWERAIGFLGRVPESAGRDAAVARCSAGGIRLQQQRLRDAEQLLRESLRLAPRYGEAEVRLATILALEGRRWESLPYLESLIEQSAAGIQELALLANPDRTLAEESYLRQCAEVTPQDARIQLGLARIAIENGRVSEGVERLRSAVASEPELMEAQARLGITFSETEPERIPDWHRALPGRVDEHPGIWLVRGRWLQGRDQVAEAARCFWEAARRNPRSFATVHELVHALHALGRRTEALAVLERQVELQRELNVALDYFWKHRDDRRAIPSIVLRLDRLGRRVEAVAWLRWALESHPNDDDLRAMDAALRASGNAATSPEDQFPTWSALAGMEDVPLPSWDSLERAEIQVAAQEGVRFRDDAERLGIAHTYFNSPDPATEGMRMFEFTGGGVAVLDLDLDGWPDFYFTQGCEWPVDESRAEHRDRCFRHLGNRFVEVSQQAGLIDARFGQGCAVGDFDNDGFPDLYVANIGVNRLFHNQGDGTFVDAGPAAGVRDSQWTTSCVVADLNGDSFPDLYDVNYLAGDNAFSMICQQGGVSRACDQTLFQAARDRVYLNQADGAFRDETDAADLNTESGAGLGIVAADFANHGRIDLFVANDAQPNFYLIPEPTGERAWRLRDEAFLRACAVDGSGRTQACMGVAAGDANGDQLIDLFVTNFYNESNTLYQQDEFGAFLDASRRAGLTAPSLLRLGFGTQFLDADNDGWLDLVVVNGDVDDFSHLGRPFRQTPQYFRNVGGGKFQEVSAEQLGPFFHAAQLGRAVVTVDWNRDGRVDWVASHLDTPVAVLTNTSSATGHFLALRLHGVASARDAIGARVDVFVDSRTLSAQLTAGDGYLASNERCLRFGLGDHTSIERLEIVWPSGTRQIVPSPPVDETLIVVEGSPGFHTLPRP